jgi:hypothetical protein
LSTGFLEGSGSIGGADLPPLSWIAVMAWSGCSVIGSAARRWLLSTACFCSLPFSGNGTAR